MKIYNVRRGKKAFMKKERYKEVDKHYKTLKKIAKGKKFIIDQVDQNEKFDSEHEKYMEVISVLHFFRPHELDDIENRIEREIESAKRLAEYRGVLTIFASCLGMLCPFFLAYVNEKMSITRETLEMQGLSGKQVLNFITSISDDIYTYMIILIISEIFLILGLFAVLSVLTSKPIDRGTFLLNIIKKYKKFKN